MFVAQHTEQPLFKLRRSGMSIAKHAVPIIVPYGNEFTLHIHVSHYPPGTSKWNPIEHRMFCHISHNWRGQPLLTRDMAVKLIGNTTTKTGLSICARLDEQIYEKGRKVTDEELAAVNMTRLLFQGKWNYTIRPTQSLKKCSGYFL